MTPKRAEDVGPGGAAQDVPRGATDDRAPAERVDPTHDRGVRGAVVVAEVVVVPVEPCRQVHVAHGLGRDAEDRRAVGKRLASAWRPGDPSAWPGSRPSAVVWPPASGARVPDGVPAGRQKPGGHVLVAALLRGRSGILERQDPDDRHRLDRPDPASERLRRVERVERELAGAETLSDGVCTCVDAPHGPVRTWVPTKFGGPSASNDWSHDPMATVSAHDQTTVEPSPTTDVPLNALPVRGRAPLEAGRRDVQAGRGPRPRSGNEVLATGGRTGKSNEIVTRCRSPSTAWRGGAAGHQEQGEHDAEDLSPDSSERSCEVAIGPRGATPSPASKSSPPGKEGASAQQHFMLGRRSIG